MKSTMTNLLEFPQFGELIFGGKEMLFTPGTHIEGLDIHRVVPKGNPQLKATMDKTEVALKADGMNQRILHECFGADVSM